MTFKLPVARIQTLLYRYFWTMSKRRVVLFSAHTFTASQGCALCPEGGLLAQPIVTASLRGYKEKTKGKWFFAGQWCTVLSKHTVRNRCEGHRA